jgi:hypothetical protein
MNERRSRNRMTIWLLSGVAVLNQDKGLVSPDSEQNIPASGYHFCKTFLSTKVYMIL